MAVREKKFSRWSRAHLISSSTHCSLLVLLSFQIFLPACKAKIEAKTNSRPSSKTLSREGASNTDEPKSPGEREGKEEITDAAAISPEAPSNISVLIPSAVVSNNSTPTLRVFGTQVGATVEVFSDTCLTSMGTAIATGSYTDITIIRLTTDGIYSFHARQAISGTSSACSPSTATYTLDTVAPNDPNLFDFYFAAQGLTPSMYFSADLDPTYLNGRIEVHSDAVCSNLLGAGSLQVSNGLHETTVNVSSPMPANTTVNMFFRVADLAGNPGNCLALADYSTDVLAPTVGSAGAITLSNVTARSVKISVTGGTDNNAASLTYSFYRSSTNNISTVLDAQAHGQLLTSLIVGSGGSTVTWTATGLSESTPYFFNVIVSDENNNKSAYNYATATTDNDRYTWTWFGGDQLARTTGSWGTKGVASASNWPGPRSGQTTWKDQNGIFWLFGGTGPDAYGRANSMADLWKFDGTNWTWVAGDSGFFVASVFGVKGSPDPANHPSSRTDSVGWTDSSGNIWIFGGSAYGPSPGSGGYYNDLWKFDGTNWTWVGGSSATLAFGIYGTKGVANPLNMPGGRSGANVWQSGDGTVWLFGGQGLDGSGALSAKSLNDLWKFDGTSWTWVNGSSIGDQLGTYGTMGVAADANAPGARHHGSSATDSGGNLVLFGGFGLNSIGGPAELNDLWRFDGTRWTWVSGNSTSFTAGIYGTKGTPAGGNTIGSRKGAVALTKNDGSIWVFGGHNSGATYNDLWRYAGGSWTWMAGDQGNTNSGGIAGGIGVSHPTYNPPGKASPTGWSDSSGNFWIFGGTGYDSLAVYSGTNDLWRYDGAEWAFMGGQRKSLKDPSYGAKGVASPFNLPGARDGAFTWKKLNGHFMMFGGEGVSTNGATILSDLWEFDGTNWIWVDGPTTSDGASSYGTRGVSLPSNWPPARYGGGNWAFSDDSGWIFGGYKMGSLLNDLWRYKNGEWTWMKGSNTPGATGSYGIKGVAGALNTPGARQFTAIGQNVGDVAYVFGGNGPDSINAWGYLNDLWKFDGSDWTWLSGDNLRNQPGIYGTKGVGAVNNTPGGRINSAFCVDQTGNVWLFGGYGYGTTGYGYLSDLWKFNGTQWTWVAGEAEINFGPGVGEQGNTVSYSNPGGHSGHTLVCGPSGEVWLIGGTQAPAPYGLRYSNSVWKYSDEGWVWITGNPSISSYSNASLPNFGTLGVAANSNVPPPKMAPAMWIGGDGAFWFFGGNGGDRGLANDLWKFVP